MFRHALLITFFIAAIFNSGCTKLGRGISSLNTSSNYATSQYSSGNFILSTVLASQQSAGSQYDLVGQGNEFDNYCGDTSAPCKCEYTFVQGGTSQTAEATPTYQESNLIRCANMVPSGISSFDVRITTANNVNYSNTITVNLNNGTFAGSTLYLDLSNSESFVQAKRFQCRRHEFIANPMDSTIIDPIQSEDPKVIYPFNFYTTNVSESLLKMQRLGNQTWECTLTATEDRSLHWWANASVFSASPCTDTFCAGDGELMYPQTDLISGKIPVNNPLSVGKRRGSFWMSKQAYGVFQIPVQTAIAPKDYVSATYGVIGYAAKPIPSTSGSSVCPSIPLPNKATWVKIWNYRATDITPPKKVTSSQSISLSGILCNPGDVTAFPTCGIKVTPGGAVAFGAGINTANATTLSSRVIAIDSQYGNANACYNIDTSAVGTSDFLNPANAGKETWLPSMSAFGDPAATPNGGLTIAQIESLPWGLYTESPPITNICKDLQNPAGYRLNKGGSCPGGPGPSNLAMTSPPTSGVPSDNQVVAVPMANDNYTDQIFIVTDPNVDDSQMRNQSPSVSQYRPVTYRTNSDCSGVSRATCASNKELHWDVNVKEVGNAASGDLYPLCVLQFYD